MLFLRRRKLVKDLVTNSLNSSTFSESICNFSIKTAKIMTVVEMESLFSTPMPSFLANTSARINRIKHVILENNTGQDTVKKEDMKQQVEMLQNENNRRRMESESLL